MTTQSPPPDGIDITRPNVARIYDYLFGGKDNFAVDREAARRLIEAIPDVAAIARDNRSFLGRVVRYLATKGGIRQFLDLGGGLPTQANVHELAQGVAPDARVVYVDNDPWSPRTAGRCSPPGTGSAWCSATCATRPASCVTRTSPACST